MGEIYDRIAELEETLDKVQESWTDAKLRIDELERECERLRQLVYLAHDANCDCGICLAVLTSSPEYEPEAIICCICDKPIEGDDMQDRYWLHEIGCDFYETGSCDCDLECHADCYKGHESEYLEYDEEETGGW